jgi:hypothetical protein
MPAISTYTKEGYFRKAFSPFRLVGFKLLFLRRAPVSVEKFAVYALSPEYNINRPKSITINKIGVNTYRQ